MNMKRHALLALLLLPACGEVHAPTSGRAATLAIVDVHVVPMDQERVLEHQTVLIQDGRVSSVGPASEVEVPAGATRVEATGKYLLPGLAEMHGHLPNPDTPAALTENVLFLYVANGVTTVRGMQGNPSQIELRKRIESGEILGPRLILGSPSMTGERVPTVADATRLVREYDEAGFDLLKVHEGLTPEVYDAIATTAKEVGIPFGGHVSDSVGLFRALASGQTTIDHLDNYVEALVPDEKKPEIAPGLLGADALLESIDESRLPEAVRATLEADASVVPTMVLWENGIYASRPSSELLSEITEVRYMPDDMVGRWSKAVDERVSAGGVEKLRRLAELRRRVLVALQKGGVRILLGTDSPQIFSVPGFSIHREMALYVEVGMTPFEVLSSGTRVVGQYFGADFGTVEAGKSADLILVDGNPLEDLKTLSKPAGVVVRGRYLPRGEIDEKLETIAASYRK
jgi:imidazolonepropionase-like amidohydrolase